MLLRDTEPDSKSEAVADAAVEGVTECVADGRDSDITHDAVAVSSLLAEGEEVAEGVGGGVIVWV